MDKSNYLHMVMMDSYVKYKNNLRIFARHLEDFIILLSFLKE